MKVDVAYPYTSKDGESYAPGEAADLPESEALRLIDRGFARKPESDSDPEPEGAEQSTPPAPASKPEPEQPKPQAPTQPRPAVTAEEK